MIEFGFISIYLHQKINTRNLQLKNLDNKSVWLKKTALTENYFLGLGPVNLDSKGERSSSEIQFMVEEYLKLRFGPNSTE
jgi:hypothetical protein